MERQINLPGQACKMHYEASTGLVFVSAEYGVYIYKDDERIHYIPGGRAMAVSPSGKYLVTSGGVYEAQAPFGLIQKTCHQIDHVIFLETDDYFVGVSDGCVELYCSRQFENQPINWVMKDSVSFNERVRLIEYCQGERRFVVLDEKGGLYIAGNHIGFGFDQPFLLCLAKHLPRKDWAQQEFWHNNVRLVVEGDRAMIIDPTGIDFKDMKDYQSKIIRHELSIDSPVSIRNWVTRRDFVQSGSYTYYMTQYGGYLIHVEESKKEDKPENVSKTGRTYGVVTRSQALAAEKLKSIIKV